MFTIALIGADGAGKTTIGQRLENTLPLPVKYIYMGVNPDASNYLLPTTRLIRAFKRARGTPPDLAGPPDPERVRHRPRHASKRTVSTLRSTLRLANRLAEEWFRQALAWYYQARGYIVVFDRHFFHDYYAHDIANTGPEWSFSRRIHGLILSYLYPKPDLVICLDAPAEILFARKGEGTVETLDRRRQEYLQLRDCVKHFALVDASRPEDDVLREVTDLIWSYYQSLGKLAPGGSRVPHMRQLKRASDRRSSSRRRIETTGAGSRQAAWSRYAAKAATRPALPA